MATKSYTLADNSTVTVESADAGIPFNDGMRLLSQAARAKIDNVSVFYDTAVFNAGFSAADSISAAFGDYDSINFGKHSTIRTANDYVQLLQSTVNADNSHITGNPTFDSKITLDGGFKVAASINSAFGNYDSINFGDYSTISASDDYISIPRSTVNANSTHITGNPTFDNKITLDGGLKTADSIQANFGQYSVLNLDNYSKLKVQNNGTVEADHSYLNLNHSELNLTNGELNLSSADLNFSGTTNLNGNPGFNGTPVFKKGFDTADSITAEFGHYSVLKFNSNSSIKGNPIFTGTPTFLNGASGISSGGTIDTSQFATKSELATAISGIETIDTSNLATKTELASAIGAATVDTSQFATKADLETITSGGNSYTLTPASADSLGGIKVGNGLSITADGKLNVTLQAGSSSSSISPNFAEKVTLQSGFTVDPFINSTFGDHDSINFGNYSTIRAAYDYVQLMRSTVNANNATVTGNPTFTGTPKFNGGFRLGSDANQIDSINIVNNKLIIVSSGQTYEFNPTTQETATDPTPTPTVKQEPSIVFDPAEMSTVSGINSYSFSYTITSDATYHTYYFTDSRYPRRISPNPSGDSGVITMENNSALNNTINDVTHGDSDASTDSGTITYYITVPETDNYEEGVFTYQIAYKNC